MSKKLDKKIESRLKKKAWYFDSADVLKVLIEITREEINARSDEVVTDSDVADLIDKDIIGLTEKIAPKLRDIIENY
jgi:hypothetical protein